MKVLLMTIQNPPPQLDSDKKHFSKVGLACISIPSNAQMHYTKINCKPPCHERPYDQACVDFQYSLAHLSETGHSLCLVCSFRNMLLILFNVGPAGLSTSSCSVCMIMCIQLKQTASMPCLIAPVHECNQLAAQLKQRALYRCLRFPMCFYLAQSFRRFANLTASSSARCGLGSQVVWH